MALIYASAVNKRMNAPRQKRSLADGSSCMETSLYSSHSRQRSNEDKNGHTNCAFEINRERNQRKRSTSQNSCSNSSCCQTPPPNSLADSDQETLRNSMNQSIHRSKTSAADVNRKLTMIQIAPRPAPRKISTPLMSQSVCYESTFKQHSSMKNSLRKTLAKKRMVKENHNCKEELAQLAVSDSDHSDREELLSNTKANNTKTRRRRSLSMDATNENDEQKAIDKRVASSKPTAFQRMCTRLQKWKIHA